MTGEPRLVEVRRNILKENDVRARALRQRFHESGMRVVSLVSSPGSGKTTLLERMLTDFRRSCRVAALVGDLATENDAARLARSGVPVRQISTGTVCHLDATMIERAFTGWLTEPIDLLFIENVGNLVCPASFDIGEDVRLVLVSTTEGEDKPVKYPTIFNSADAAVITKIDLAAALEFDEQALLRNIQTVRPAMPSFRVSSRTGEGISELERFLTADSPLATASGVA